MKHLKQKLMAATAMLMVSAVMLTTSTYAWFAISTAPEVSTITTTISTTTAFEIALGTDGITSDDEPSDSAIDDSSKDTTWGATVTEVNGFSGLEFPIAVTESDDKTSDDPTTDTEEATETISSIFKTAAYGSDGRAYGYTGVTTDSITYAGGIASVTATIDSTEKVVVASSTLLWLRSNTTIADVEAKITGFTVAATDDDETTTLGVSDIGVAIFVDGTLMGTATGTASTDGVTIDFGTTEFAANDAKYVEVYVYLLGDSLQNSDLTTATTVTIDSIEFISSTISGS